MRELTFQDEARLEYGRLLWHNADAKARLLRHWTDPRHPYAERFQEKFRPWIERLLSRSEEDDDQLDTELRKAGLSLRVIVKEIPPVFGSFY